MEQDPTRIAGVPLTRHWLIPQALRPKVYTPHPVMEADEIRRRTQARVGRLLQPAEDLGSIEVRDVAQVATRVRAHFEALSADVRQHRHRYRQRAREPFGPVGPDDRVPVPPAVRRSPRCPISRSRRNNKRGFPQVPHGSSGFHRVQFRTVPQGSSRFKVRGSRFKVLSPRAEPFFFERTVNLVEPFFFEPLEGTLQNLVELNLAEPCWNPAVPCGTQSHSGIRTNRLKSLWSSVASVGWRDVKATTWPVPSSAGPALASIHPPSSSSLMRMICRSSDRTEMCPRGD